jgi:uncharacterized LabA/DUF88 family protein
MTILSAGYNGPKEIKYLFVDGGCLRQMVEDAAARYEGFAIQHLDFSKTAVGYSKAFYYDSLPPRKKDEDDCAYDLRSAPAEDFFSSLRAIPGVHVYEGDARRRRKQVQQKKVDIMIAVDMLTHSFSRNMHQAALLTSDLDFKPLIDALVQHGMHVELWYPHGKPNRELIYAADVRRPLTFRDLYEWSADEFRKSHPMPRATSARGKNIQGGLLMDSWTTGMGTTAELFRMESGDIFTVVFPAAVGDGCYTHVSHRNLELLRAYITECFREFWKDPL